MSDTYTDVDPTEMVTVEVEEIWKPIPLWQGYYEVSNRGRVRSVQRVVTLANKRTRTYASKLLALSDERGGYKRVSLRRPGIRITGRVHRLVLTAFVSPPPTSSSEACHIDGNPANNAVHNLYWGTSSDNKHDIVKLGHHAGANKTTCPHGHNLTSPNLRESAYRHGRRACLACHKERGQASYQRRDFSEANADRLYKQIMEGPNVRLTK